MRAGIRSSPHPWPNACNTWPEAAQRGAAAEQRADAGLEIGLERAGADAPRGHLALGHSAAGNAVIMILREPDTVVAHDHSGGLLFLRKRAERVCAGTGHGVVRLFFAGHLVPAALFDERAPLLKGHGALETARLLCAGRHSMFGR